MSEASKFRECQRRWDNLTPEDLEPKPRKRTEFDEDEKKRCKMCGEWKWIPPEQHVCEACWEETKD